MALSASVGLLSWYHGARSQAAGMLRFALAHYSQSPFGTTSRHLRRSCRSSQHRPIRNRRWPLFLFSSMSRRIFKSASALCHGRHGIAPCRPSTPSASVAHRVRPGCPSHNTSVDLKGLVLLASGRWIRFQKRIRILVLISTSLGNTINAPGTASPPSQNCLSSPQCRLRHPPTWLVS